MNLREISGTRAYRPFSFLSNDLTRMDSIVLEQRMPHSKIALILMVAFGLPGAAEALGLGEIHVDSALNEPLAAEVDIVGATAEDLAGINASVANNETFLRFGIDRPAFLTTASFKIVADRNGQPVLAIRSTSAFTEPLINMLIDLRWRNGELIREYTLLLDPASFPSDSRVADAARNGSEEVADTSPAAPKQLSETSQAPSPATPRPERTSPADGGPVAPKAVKVAAGATLRGIASRADSRGDMGLERMMIAIFRANPEAFEGNINRLRRGVVLAIPSFPEVSKISSAEANREVRLQMETWHASTHFVGPAKTSALAAAAPAPVPHEAEIPAESVAAHQVSTATTARDGALTARDGAIDAAGNTAESSDDAPLDRAAPLDRRVQILEKGLNELQGALDREQHTLDGIQARVALADKAPAVTTLPPPPKSGHAIGASIVAVLALASGTFGIIYAWRRRRTFYSTVSPADSTVSPVDARTQNSGIPQIAAHVGAAQEPTLAHPPAASQELTPAAVARNEPPPVAPIAARARTEVRHSIPDTSADERTMLVAEVLDGIGIESLAASNFSEPSGGSLEPAVSLDTAGTANLASTTIKLRAPDANAETTPLEAVRIAEVPEISTPEHSAPDNPPLADKLDADTAKLQYKVIDLGGTVHHVPMPSILYQKGEFKERRTSLVDVLKVAVKREPNRRDLRMKLLETYYAAAATSRQGFLEIAQSLASERENMTDGEWGKITGMGRQIAADNDLFSPDDLASCA
jgi:pilus assembly protein FimV